MIGWYGALLRSILLGTKWEDCSECGGVTHHAVVRATTWFHMWRVPLVLTGVRHYLRCARCGTWTRIPWRAVRSAMKTRLMPLALERPSFDDLRDDLWTLTGRRPTAADIFDRVEVNPRRGGWDLYTKVWPVLVGLLIVAVIVFPRQAGALVGNPEAQNGRAHTCWLSSTEFDALAGCRMNDGTLVGHTTKVTTTCFFDEPMDETKDTVPCH